MLGTEPNHLASFEEHLITMLQLPHYICLSSSLWSVLKLVPSEVCSPENGMACVAFRVTCRDCDFWLYTSDRSRPPLSNTLKVWDDQHITNSLNYIDPRIIVVSRFNSMGYYQRRNNNNKRRIATSS